MFGRCAVTQYSGHHATVWITMVSDPNIELIDARCFLAIASEGSIRAAARATGIPLNTLRYRLERLEQRMGAPLFHRSRDGTEPTETGKRMRVIAVEMIEAAGRIDGAPRDMLVRPGQFTIACSEALATLWLTPRLGALREAVGNLTIGLECRYDLTRNHEEDADIGVIFTPPDDQELIIARLATLHFLLYASSDYLEAHGAPASPEAMRDHIFIEQEAPGLSPQIRPHLVGDGGEGSIYLRTNASLALYYAVASGAGIAAMPSYVSLLSTAVVPIDIPVRLRFEMYYFCHRRARRSAAVRAGIDWLKRAFDPRCYPCFADRFVHPDDFPEPAEQSDDWLPGL